MKQANPSFSNEQQGDENEQEDTAKRQAVKVPTTPDTLAKAPQPSIVTRAVTKLGSGSNSVPIEEKHGGLEHAEAHDYTTCRVDEATEFTNASEDDSNATENTHKLAGASENNAACMDDGKHNEHTAASGSRDEILDSEHDFEQAFTESIDTETLTTIPLANTPLLPDPITPIPTSEDMHILPDPITPIPTDAPEEEAIKAITPLELVSVNPPRGDHDPILQTPMSRGRAIFLAALLLILVFNAISLGSSQFIGAQGWAYVLGGPVNTNDPNLLKDIVNQLHQHATPGATTQTTRSVTPQQYINLIVQNMTLNQKLGQMMIVQFTGPVYGLDISTMITQYNVGATLIYSTNDNIHDKIQLRNLISQMQTNSVPIPLAVAIDQEGGTVDRLINLDGSRPSATSIGQTNDPARAMAEGVLDANDLSYYGINLNLAPVVDVTNIYNPQLYLRTYGNNATIVTKMAEAYLRGLQQSGKVLGTLKHFPGLGDVGADPHNSIPYLNRSQSQLEEIDWAPYRSLIRQGNVHAIMVTHEIVTQIDSKNPSSLSHKLVTGILRNELGFQGVIMTDSLTMEGITAYYSESQAAALAVEAGSDLLMGATSPRQVGNMINGIKQAINNGSISMQRIDDSVRRILMMKYEMGLLHIP